MRPAAAPAGSRGAPRGRPCAAPVDHGDSADGAATPEPRRRGRPPRKAATPCTATLFRVIDPAVFAQQAARPDASAVERLAAHLESFVTLPDDTVLSCVPQLKKARRAPGAMTVPDQPETAAAAEPARSERAAQMAADHAQWVDRMARTMNRISELRRRGLLRDSGEPGDRAQLHLLPPPLPEPAPHAQEPPRTKTWRDRLTADAVERHREMAVAARRRRAVLRKCSRQIAREDDERQARLGIYKRPEEAERAERALQMRLAKWTAQQVMRKWTYIESVVDEERQVEEEEQRSREDKKALVDMLHRSTRLLEEQRATHSSSSSSEDESDGSTSTAGTDAVSDVGSARRKGASDSEAASDSEGEASSDGEMDGLARDQDMPIEELLASYSQPPGQAADDAAYGVVPGSPAVGGSDAGETEATRHTLEQPALLRGELREYQRQGLDWLASLHQHQTNGILADEMGLGKTIQTIALLAHLACDRGIWGPHLIIVPTSVLLNWEQELHRWLPGFKVLTYYGSRAERKQRRKGWSKPNAFHVCVTSYQLAIQDAAAFRRKPWYYMVLDEAQAIKNFRSQRWQTLLAFRSSARLLLTGTPLQNSLMELWSLMYFLMPRELGDGSDSDGFAGLERFREWFAQPLDRLLAANPEIAAPVAAQGTVAFNTTAFLHDSGALPAGGDDAELLVTQTEAQQAVQKLHTVLRPHILRRLKQDVETQLPCKVERVVYCHMSKRQRFLYDDFMSRAQTRETLSGGTYLGVMGCLMQLRKVCNHPDLFETRPIVTSWVVSGADVARYRQTEDLVRRMLTGDAPWQESGRERWRLRGLLFTSVDEGDAVQHRVRQLDAAALLLREALSAAQSALEIVATEEKSWDELQLRPRESHLCSVRASVQRQRLADVQRSSSAWMRLFAQNRARIPGYGPVYSAGALRALRAVNSVRERLGDTCAAELVPTGAQLLERHHSTVANFVFVTPPVVVTNVQSDLEAVYPHLRPECRGAWAEELAPNVLHMQRRVARRTGALRALEVRQQIAFPEPFLLQYDCGKLQELARLLRRLAQDGHRVLVFTQMTRMLDLLETWLNLHGYRYLRLDGSTRVEQRWRLTEQFNHDARWTVFISSTRAGGLGINLTGADTVVFYDSDWNHAMDAQCQDRCHRIGQQREVHIYRLITERSVEEAIWRKQCEKRWLDNVVIQQGQFDPNKRANDAAPPPPPKQQPQLQPQSLGAGDWYDLATAVLQQSSGGVARPADERRAASEYDAADVAEDEADAAALKAAIVEVAQADALDLGDDQTPVPGEAAAAAAAADTAAIGGDDDGIGHIDDYMVRFLAL
ncbi:swr1 complex component [Coemansia spiralis]|nr:swr1 complex component [Coemansia spiralis]